MQGQSRYELHVAGVPLISFQLGEKKKIPGYRNMTMTTNESRLSGDFGASVSFVCACACVCVLRCRVDLLDNLRAHFQSHSVWLESLSGVTFSITLKLQAAHLKLCAAISYHVIRLNQKRRAPDVAAAGLMNLSSQKTSQTSLCSFVLFCVSIMCLFVLFLWYVIYYQSYFGHKHTSFKSVHTSKWI